MGRAARSLAALLAGLALLVVFAAVAVAAPVGQITEFSNGLGASDDPGKIVPGSDGNLWFTIQVGTRAIGRITPSGTITEFTAGLQPNGGSLPTGIAPGPDGNLWFSDAGTKAAIGRITPSGAITEFSDGLQANGGSFPESIALGPDGNLWFTDPSLSTGVPSIGRITPSGTITEFSAGLGVRSRPIDIARGPDGNMWFTDDGCPVGGSCAIGRITPDGTITEFTTGLQANGASHPIDIAAGPDGNVWFTDESLAPAIGRITPDGTITEFPVPLTANGIAAGPDGNLWFAVGSFPPAIGRITPTGTVTEFTTGLLPNNASIPFFMTAGPDGNLWFSDSFAIGRIGAGAPAASVRAPSVTGSGQQGTQQVCQGDLWTQWAGEPPSFAAFAFDGYRWSRDGSPIAGATGQSYTPITGDIGHQLSCAATVTYPLFDVTDTGTSAPVTVIPQSSGPTGLQGPAGANGSQGLPGATGLTGPQGQAGPQGTAGQVELVTCKTVTRTVIRHGRRVKVKRQQCTTKQVTGPVKFTTASAAARATLSRGRVVYATGYSHQRSSGPQTTLLAARPLRPGRYTLTLTSRRGRHTVRTSSAITIG